MSPILTVFLKEVKDSLHDKRTILSALLYGPLIGPLLFALITNAIVTREIGKADRPLRAPVIGARYAPNLLRALAQDGFVALPPVDDPLDAVRRRDADVILRIPPGYDAAWRRGESAQVEVIYDSSQRDAAGSIERLKAMLEGYAHAQAAMRLIARGLSPALLTPVRVDARDQSTPRSRAGLLFALLPYFFVLTVFVGGMYLAIDLTAGERERQSLEPLFVNPVPRRQILIGKLAALCVFSLASLVICIVAFGITSRFMPTDRLGMTEDLGPAFALRVLLLMLPLVALLAALQTLVAAFAKSYREAQSYLSILMLVPVLPSVLLSVLPVKVAGWMYAVPLLAQQVGITELLRGGTVGAAPIALCLATGGIAALLATWLTARVYASERLAISA
jgi:sodium transport system permease protein